MTPRPVRIALAHDYLTQKGGAERVALLLARTFPEATLHTSLYAPELTYPEFGKVDIDVLPLDRLRPLRRHHRLAFPLLAPSFWARVVAADVLVVSSSGWAHGLRTTGRKIVYCHAPARWLYQPDRYLGARSSRSAAGLSLSLLSGPLRRWDKAAAATADRYLANSTTTRDAIRAVYGIDAEVLPPPPALVADGAEDPTPGIGPGYLLCVARLLPYKNVDVVVGAASLLDVALVVVGDGPERHRLQSLAAGRPHIRFVGAVSDARLRWLYHHCQALVTASHEDYGLSPLEAASFGHPAVVLRDGGFLDTVAEGKTGVFFDRAEAPELAAALEQAMGGSWDPDLLRSHAAGFSAERFSARLGEVVSEELRLR